MRLQRFVEADTGKSVYVDAQGVDVIEAVKGTDAKAAVRTTGGWTAVVQGTVDGVARRIRAELDSDDEKTGLLREVLPYVPPAAGLLRQRIEAALGDPNS